MRKMIAAPNANKMPDDDHMAVIFFLPDALRVPRQNGAYHKDMATLHEELVGEIRYCIARGIAVVVRGWNPEICTDFSINDVSMIRPSIEQTVSWQGEHYACSIIFL